MGKLSRFLTLCIIPLGLGSCNLANQGNNNSAPTSKLFSKKPSDVTENEVLGYWQASIQGDRSSDLTENWRVKIEPKKMSFAVRCFEGGDSAERGAEIEIEIEEQSSRSVVTFLETKDFRKTLINENCGAAIFKDDFVFLTTEGLRLDITPLFNDTTFEKIADLEDERSSGS